MRTAMVVAVVVSCVVVAGAAEDWSAYKPQIEALLADEVTVGFELASTWRAEDPLPDDPWPDPGVRRLDIGKSSAYGQGYAVIDTNTQQVIGLVAPKPAGPVPMDQMTPEQAIEVATQVCRQRMPELFAEGGEVVSSVADEISPLGAWMVTLQRTVSGVGVPTAAMVGVRVYDGKVPYWRRRHIPLDGGVQLPGEVTLEQARQVAAANMPDEFHQPLLWFDEVHEVILTDEGQQNVWTLWAEIRDSRVTNNSLQAFRCWRVDAGSGELVSMDKFSDQSREVVWRYYAAGGTHVPRNGRPNPDPMVTDSAPRWSPDGSRLLFSSQRPREGYPAWFTMASGLFMVNADGSDLRCLVPAGAGRACFSPDGAKLAYVSDGVIVTLDLTSGTTQRFASPFERWTYIEALWTARGLVVKADEFAMNSRLYLLDAADPAAAPVQLQTGIAGAEYVGGLALDEQGRLLFVVQTRTGMTPPKDPERRNHPYRLCRLDPLTAEAEPEVLVQYMDAGREIARGPGGQLMLSDGTNWFATDPATGASAPWRPTPVPMPGTEGQLRITPEQVAFSPDGSRIAFVSMIRDTSYEKLPAVLIWTSDPDGANLTQVTPWGNEFVEMVGE